MDFQNYEARWRYVFAENVRRRSRTAQGQDKGSETSSTKKPLLLQGDALKARTAENVARLIDDVWESRLLTVTDPNTEKQVRFHEIERYLSEIESHEPLSEEIEDPAPKWFRGMCERWYDIASDGLVDQGADVDALATLSEHATRAGKISDRYGRVNPRYRVWTPAYTTLLVPPIGLEDAMDEFYGSLTRTIQGIDDHLDRDDSDPELIPCIPWEHTLMVLRAAAYADVMMDGEVHPWLDGCSRVSTAVVMWIAASFEEVPPLFAPTKKEHYLTIRDLDAHARYMQECFFRTRTLEL